MSKLLPMLQEKITNVAKKFPIAAMYLHGSYALGTATKESDLDLAILATKECSTDERMNLRLNIQVALFQECGTSLPELDVIILQDAPLLLQMNVLRRGICIRENDRAERIGYELLVEQEYDDERIMIDAEHVASRRSILSHAS